MDRKVKQASLLSLLANASPSVHIGLAGLMPDIRAQMNRAARGFELGRKVLVDEVNSVAEREGVALTNNGGKKITAEQLDKWLQASSKGHAPTFEAVICFCIAIGDFSPLSPLFERLGLTVIPKAEVRYLELGRAQAEYEAARARLKTARVKV
ncbi:hypothetical protein LJC46_02305 [Desulfovibrio sp. OttesenSCG-928-G15]|nr:hypothetical protein [Desulfovibrio sp. OttesenSCG-928-G15]